MKSETPLDYAVFSLSPRRSRCELLVTSDGITEKLASGLLKPFATHLKVAEEQVASAVQSIKLEAERCNNAEAWFTKGTLERFVRFVSTPEVLELVNTFDVEMSQLEAARKIYSQGVSDHHSNASGGDGMGATAAADATKKELLRAIDVRLVALKQDLITACARASAAGFNPGTVSGLQHFADQFGAYRLKEACAKSLKVWERRPDLITWKPDVDDKAVRSSTGSDMSIDEPTGPVPDAVQAQQPRSINAQPGASVSETEKQNKEDSQSPTESSSSSIQKSQPGRRLSVQDRINMFESKQKENSGGKPVAKPAELRRLSSDVSSGPGPAVVLRRWSGASDMSIDVSGEKKDSAESPLCTPSSSSSVSQARSNVFSGKPEDKNQKGLNHSGIFVDSGLKDEAESQTQNKLVKEDEVGLKGHANRKEQQSGSQAHLRGFGGRVEQLEVNDHVDSLENEERSGGIKDQPSSVTKLKGLPDIGVKNPGSSQTKIVSSRADDGNSWHKHQRLGQTHIRHPQSHFRSLSGQLDGGFELQLREFQDKYNEGDTDQLLPQPRWNEDLGSSEKQAAKAEDSGVLRMKFKKTTPAGPEQIKKSQGQMDDDSYLSGSSKQGFLGTRVLENDDSFGTPREHVQRVRQSKGKQDANDELKMKASELEKLFAEHKLRVPGDQSGSARRGKSADTHLEQPVSFQYKNPAVPVMSPVKLADRNSMIEPSGSSGNMNFKTPPVKMADNQDYGDIPRPKSSDCGFAVDSKGKFYERYMLKRNAKLKEEWGSNREEKEAKMKAMRDNLEQSNAELKAKLSDGDKSLSARRHAEKLVSFNARSNWKRDQLIDSMLSEEDEDLTEFLDQKSYGQDRSFSETFFSDAGSRSSASKKNFPPRIASSTPRTATAPIPKPSIKSSNPESWRRKVQVENPLAQSVPNFSDIRKENTKPFFGVGKMTTRSQVRNSTRNKSAHEEIILAKEEKTRRQQSVRKSTANPVEFKDVSPMNSDDIDLGPLKEQTESILHDTFSRHVDSKPFLRKGNGIGPGSGASIAKLKVSMASEMREEEFDELPFEEENSGDILKEEELDNATADDYDDMDNEKLSQESDKLGDSGSENGDSIRSLSQVNLASVPELPAPVSSSFHHIGSLQDSQGESPISWNSRMHHPFSFQHEMSDIDASADSPMGSPASWNSHSLAQTDADAARMRKKWGNAQKPILVSNSSHNQSRKDMTKGFKRLLKFGRKKSGTDSLVDWISATTSEGDDDIEDGRDPANRSSDDLRKSRMGFSHGHPSDDGFNDSELFNEQVQDLRSSIPAPPANFRLREDHISGSSLKAPRSFFSLSTFRSKGSDSKPR